MIAGGTYSTKPDAPTVGTATATSTTTATVAFTAPARDGGATITSYTATSSPGGVTGTLSQAGSGTITVSGLTTGTAYTFTVTATNSVGTSVASSASNSITTYLAPANTVAPVVSGTATRGQTLSSTTGTWSGVPTPTFGYQWQRAGSNIGGATSSTYTLVTDDVGNAIRCVVTATNAVSAVSANSNATAAVAAVVPGAPTIGTATATGPTAATVTFSAPADNGGATITSYTATSSPSGITGTLSQAGSGTITVSGLATGTAYTFTVTATNSAGTSAASAASNSITPGYQFFSWGNNVYGNLGLGNLTYTSSPVQIGALTNWSNISAGAYTNASAVKTDGTLWTWGNNGNGGLGLGNTTYYSSPKQVGSLTAWSTVSGGGNFVAATKTDGTIWTWGRNTESQLGLGDSTSRSSPVQVGTLTDWLKVSSGYRFVTAIKTNGTMWSWGQNSAGQLGDGTTTYRSSPVQIGALTTWLHVASGRYFCTAIKTNGTLWAWGQNSNGQLGIANGDFTARSSPVQIGALTTWATTGPGRAFVLATTTGGALYAWGRNNFGQLGQGSTAADYQSPRQIGGLTTWLKVAGGVYNSAAIKTDGTLWTWGQAQNGVLGLGFDNTDYSSPKQVGSRTTWNTISAGYRYILALG